MSLFSKSLVFTALLVASHHASAHTTYGGTARDLGTITGAGMGTPYFKTIDNQTVTSNFGWVAGTSASFGDAHDIKAYRFTLAEAGWATIAVNSAARGTGTSGFLPGFSLYSGLLHTNGVADYDTSAATLAYLATLGGPAKVGAFDALNTWKIGNDAGELSTLAYIGHAADGSSANPAIAGDGNADGTVRQTFWLPAGDYSLMVGGADPSAIDGTGTYGIDVSITVVPEPSAMLLGSLSGIVLFRRKRRQ